MRTDLRELLRSDYEAFARKAFQEKHGKPLGSEPYVTGVCDGLLWLRKTDGGRLVINLPPRHGKTLFGAVFYATWLLGLNPRLNIIIVTYSGELAEKTSYEIRQIMRAPWYSEVFSTRLEKDRQKVGHFVTNFGGSVFATSINGVMAGVGADYLILDDLLNLRESRDPEKVEAVNHIFDGEISSRLNTRSEGRIVVIAHRLAENDLSAHLIGKPQTRLIAYPLVAIQRTRIRLSTGVWVREKGELLRHGSHDEADIKELKLAAHPSYELYYQQGVRKSQLRLSDKSFQTYNPKLLQAGPILVSVDTAIKEGPRNSFTTMQVWAPRDDGFYLIDQFRQQVGFAEAVDALRALNNRYHPNVILIEDRANGTALITAISRRTTTTVVAVNPGQDSKTARLVRHIPLLREKPVFFPDDFVGRDSFVDEVLGRSGWTDQMDAMTQMIEYVANNRIPARSAERALPQGVGSRGQIYSDPTSRPDFSLPGAVMLLGSKRRR